MKLYMFLLLVVFSACGAMEPWQLQERSTQHRPTATSNDHVVVDISALKRYVPDPQKIEKSLAKQTGKKIKNDWKESECCSICLPTCVAFLCLASPFIAALLTQANDTCPADHGKPL